MRPGEFGYIRWIREQPIPNSAAWRDVVVGPGDDCAVIRASRIADGMNGTPEADALLIKTDSLLQGVHFSLTGGVGAATAEQVGYKLAAQNLSDIAAMGGVPCYAVVAVMFPPHPSDDLKADLHRGIRRGLDRFGVALVGGNVAAWPKNPNPNMDVGQLALTMTLIGRTLGTPPVLRSGAQPGDVVFVTGTLGGSILGHHHSFMPRVHEGRFLAQGGWVTAMIDVSDGLLADLGHLAEESHVWIELFAWTIPISDAACRLAAQSRSEPLQHALSDGEDFELAFTVPADRAEALERCWPFAPAVRLTRIGHVTGVTKATEATKADDDASQASLVRVLNPDGTAIQVIRLGYDHLA